MMNYKQICWGATLLAMLIVCEPIHAQQRRGNGNGVGNPTATPSTGNGPLRGNENGAKGPLRKREMEMQQNRTGGGEQGGQMGQPHQRLARMMLASFDRDGDASLNFVELQNALSQLETDMLRQLRSQQQRTMMQNMFRYGNPLGEPSRVTNRAAGQQVSQGGSVRTGRQMGRRGR